MFSTAKAYVAGALLLCTFGGGAWAAHKWYAAKIARYEAQIAQLGTLLKSQNAAVETWKAEAKLQADRVAAAEARQPAVIEKWKTVVQTVTQAVPGPATPCPEVSVWERVQYAKLLQAWQPSLP